MDTYRAVDDRSDADFGRDDEPAIEAPPEIGVDERRMHVRAYNYWVSLLEGRPYPSIDDVDPETLDDFGPHSVLLDFSAGIDDPAIVFIGRTLREECGLDSGIRHISDVPARSLISRLTDHYLQIIANRAPIGFEAEFVSHRGHNTMYRGILMPLSSDGDTIDFIYGVINWKELAGGAIQAQLAEEVGQLAPAAPLMALGPIWEDHDTDGAEPDTDAAEPEYSALADDQPALPLEPDAGLADRLGHARETAQAVKHADARSRAALYRALGLAYDFALAAEAAPNDYAELLDDAGVKAQARAPMTPVVKLVFGIDYDKTRLTEFAAALAHGRRQDVPQGGLGRYLETQPGGLKAIVAAERDARRPAPKPDRLDAKRAAIAAAAPLCHADIEGFGEDIVLFVARREADGRYAITAPVAHDPALIARAVRKARV